MYNGFVEYAEKMEKKDTASDEDLAAYRQLSFGRYEFDLEGKKIRLNSEGILDPPRAADIQRATAAPRFWNLAARRVEPVPPVDDVIDHRDMQTPVKDQGTRATCVPFAALAQIEAKIKATEGRTVDLSEQYTNWLLMKINGKNQCNDIIQTTNTAFHLKTHGVCEEALFAYEDREEVETHCSAEPSLQAKENARYGIADYDVLFRFGHSGPSLSNPNYIETILAQGDDIVVGLEIALIRPDDNGVFDVFLDRFRRAISVTGTTGLSGSAPGHAVLVVGYDRRPPQPHFIVKNSWGADKGDHGYFFLSYEYFTTYAKVGYTITGIRTDLTANIE